MNKTIIFPSDNYEKFVESLEVVRLSGTLSVDAINAKIKDANEKIFADAVAFVATAEKPFDYLTINACSCAMGSIKNIGQTISINSEKRVSYADVVKYANKRNKDSEKTGLTKVDDFLKPVEVKLFDLFGQNILCNKLDNLDIKMVDKLKEITGIDLECFKHNSKGKLIEQLNHLYNIIGCENHGANAIGYNVEGIKDKYITYTDFNSKGDVKHEYKEKSHTYMVDLVIKQFMISKEKTKLTVTSRQIAKEENK